MKDLFRFILLTIIFITSCKAPNKSKKYDANQTPIEQNLKQNPELQIAEYIRHICQDKNGNFWFGTNALGAAHYDGDSVTYFSTTQGFAGYQITGITEDLDENLWFATDLGIVKYDWSTTNEGQKQFTNFHHHKLFKGQRFWSITADKKGNIWAGAVTGIYKFDGTTWTPFKLPLPEEATGEFLSSGTSWSILEDRKGHMWFSTNGYGVYKYDGHSFTQYSKGDGLCDNRVDVIIEDKSGGLWFGTRNGGVCRYDGQKFSQFRLHKDFTNDEVCSIYENRSGKIWISSEGYGVYQYDGTNLINFSVDEGLAVKAVQAIFEDKEGRLWVGGGGGLYQYQSALPPSRKAGFINVKKNGPWD